MLSMFFTKINIEDPDVLVSHNLFGFEFDVILARAQALKIPNWSVIGRLRKTKVRTHSFTYSPTHSPTHSPSHSLT